MSLKIDIDLVQQVLLDDGWHPVYQNSFDLDAYEYSEQDHIRLAGGVVNGVVSTGATWVEGTKTPGKRMFCPITAIKAVKY